MIRVKYKGTLYEGYYKPDRRRRMVRFVSLWDENHEDKIFYSPKNDSFYNRNEEFIVPEEVLEKGP